MGGVIGEVRVFPTKMPAFARPALSERTRAAVHDALGAVGYPLLDRDKLASFLSEAVIGKQVVGHDAAYAAGTRNAIKTIDTVGIPIWAKALQPR